MYRLCIASVNKTNFMAMAKKHILNAQLFNRRQTSRKRVQYCSYLGTIASAIYKNEKEFVNQE